MENIVLPIHILGFVLSILSCLKISKETLNRQNKLLLLLSVTVAINYLGILTEYFPFSLEIGIYAQKIKYMGMCYFAFIALLFSLSHFKIKIPKWVVTTLGILHTFLFFMAYTFDQHTLFYSAYGINENGEMYRDGGPLYYVHFLTFIAYSAIILFLGFRYKKTAKRRIDKMVLYCIVTVCVGFVIGYGGHQVLKVINQSIGEANVTTQNIFNIIWQIDNTDWYYVIVSIAIFLLVFKYRLLDTLDLAKDKIIEKMKEGVVIVDVNEKVVYYNKEATNIFPDIALEDPITKLLQFNQEIITKNNCWYQIKRDNVAGIEATLTFYDITDMMNENKDLQQKISEQIINTNKIQENLIVALANMVDLKDGITGSHINRTSSYVNLLTQHLFSKGIYKDQITPEFIENISKAAPLHDIGKISIPDDILNKPGKLTESEFEIIKTHTLAGGSVLGGVLKDVDAKDYLSIAYDVAVYHHEKWNGKGYPTGKSGYDIPLSARIMAVADVFDALTSERSYKPTYSIKKSMQIIEEQAGKHFDPIISTAFLELTNDIEMIINKS